MKIQYKRIGYHKPSFERIQRTNDRKGRIAYKFGNRGTRSTRAGCEESTLESTDTKRRSKQEIFYLPGRGSQIQKYAV